MKSMVIFPSEKTDCIRFSVYKLFQIESVPVAPFPQSFKTLRTRLAQLQSEIVYILAFAMMFVLKGFTIKEPFKAMPG